MTDMIRPRVVDLPLHVDDRGWLFEGVHNYDLPTDQRYDLSTNALPLPPRFGQVYLVHSRTRGTVRAFHRHQVLWDLFTPAAGAAKFVVWNGRFLAGDDRQMGENSLVRLKMKDGGVLEVQELIEVVLTVEAPKLLIVPPGWYHGWMALTDGATIVSVGSELYNREKPDEERIPWDTIGIQIWQVQNR